MITKALKKTEVIHGFIQIPTQNRTDLLGKEKLPFQTKVNDLPARVDVYGRLWSEHLKNKFPINTEVIIEKHNGGFQIEANKLRKENTTEIVDQERASFSATTRYQQIQLTQILPINNGQILSFKRLHEVNNPSSVHGIFPYRGKISAIDARQLIHQLPQQGTLLDPFCGSGTIVYEAQKWGLHAIGIDNNPIACILSKAKTQPVDKLKTILHVQELIRKGKSLNQPLKMNPWPIKFFHPKTAEEIMRIHSFESEMLDYELAAFYGAIALTARACNHYQWSSNSVGKLILPQLYVDFYEKFLSKVKKHIKYVDGNIPAKIHQYDSRRLSEIIGESSVDFVYTSPPYFNALDYTSYYSRIIYEIEGFDRKGLKRNLIQHFSEYAEDMKTVLAELRNITTKNATIVFVVGDKKTKDGIINGGEFFSSITDWKPAYVVEREYTGSSSQIWDKINKTIRKEQIVIWINEK